MMIRLAFIKLFFLLLGVLSLHVSAFGQADSADSQKSALFKNEVKLNLAYLPFGYVEAGFERLLPANTSVGLAFGTALDQDIALDYHVLLYYRMFFGQQVGRGFFIEANGAHWQEDSIYFDTGSALGMGLGVGGKFFRGDRFYGEFVFGYGRTLSDVRGDFESAYPRFGIYVGYRL